MKIIEVKPQISNFLIANGADAWLEVVKSARLSGVPESVSDIDVFNMMFSNDYGSALEHIIIKFFVVLSKGNAPEFLEHRMMSHSGASTRYTSLKEFEIIVPFHLLKDEKLKSIFMKGVEESLNSYQKLIENKCPREIARYTLPFCSASAKYWCTINLRSLINFLSLRLCVRASPELRSIASQLYFLLEKELPIIKDMIGCRGYMRGVCPESGTTGYRSGENKKCPFSNSQANSFIPTKSEIKKQHSAEFDIIFGKNKEKNSINSIQKTIFKKWSEWK